MPKYSEYAVKFHNTQMQYVHKIQKQMLSEADKLFTLPLHTHCELTDTQLKWNYTVHKLTLLYIPRVLSYVFVLFVENGNLNQYNRKLPLNEASHFH